MDTNDILIEAFGRIRGLVHRVAEGASQDLLTYRPDPDANSIAWLVWHLTRVMDDHVSELADAEQEWMTGGWADRFGLSFDPTETGYGHSSEKVGEVRPSAELLIGYHEAVQDSSISYLGGLDPAELDRIVDRSWDPPVSVGIRLVSVIGDSLQHLGQAAYVKGMFERR
ncbi:MAG: mycothiol transferase [Actinomycetota bacterium]